VPINVDPQLRRLVVGVGEALGLDLYGVDVVLSGGRHYVVDVSAFPGFKSVPGADQLLAGRILEAARCAMPTNAPWWLPGAGLSILALGSLLYAIIEAPHHGWTGGATLLTATVGVAFGLLFAVRELHTPYPMLDLRFFENPRFSSASAAILLVFFALFGTFFLLTQYLQLVRGYSALGAGVRTLPAPLSIMVMAPMSAKLVERFGTRAVVASGLAIVATGLGLASTLGVDTPYLLLAGSLMILATGMALSMAPATTAIRRHFPSARPASAPR